MKRYLILAAGLVLTGTASATNPLAPAPMGSAGSAPVVGVVDSGAGGCAGCGGAVAGRAGHGFAHHDARFGWNPLFKKLAFWKRDNGCGTCGDRGGLFGRLRGLSPFGGLGGGLGGGNCAGCGGLGGAGWGHGGPAFNPYPNGVPGTLVFPQHPFVRSPRDFFMLDAR